jgi:hypothetical protein
MRDLIDRIRAFDGEREWGRYHSPKNLADQLGVDILEAAGRKLERNKEKYPVEKAKGRADKYTDLG